MPILICVVPDVYTTTAFALAVHKKDPVSKEIGDPCYQSNFLPDSRATQHMTLHWADLFDVVEGQNLGVVVAHGHIKCSTIGKIKPCMTDDNGDPLEAVLHDIMYIPGLSRCLFSVARFTKHGHFATIWADTVP
jgi:hypothetical protein